MAEGERHTSPTTLVHRHYPSNPVSSAPVPPDPVLVLGPAGESATDSGSLPSGSARSHPDSSSGNIPGKPPRHLLVELEREYECDGGRRVMRSDLDIVEGLLRRGMKRRGMLVDGVGVVDQVEESGKDVRREGKDL
jgi:hypothetical protein